MLLLENFFEESVATIILIACIVALRALTAKLIRRYALKSEILEHRVNLVIKYNSIFFTILFFVGLFIIWGVQTKDLFVTISSVLTVIGIAFFAQWSILSNITSGIILLFSFPFKIGDVIRIHDNDFGFEGEIIDIRAFHTLLKTSEGGLITYPNNLLMQKGISIIHDHTFEDKEFTD